ncbi:RNA polymerase sigma factor [Tuwongella immobilis]|uniref:RNA polymerase sigma-70 region 2 domain-containing protein n=1 Tax=Tuwongella immobilis TaxID=692036 RepID=A0A6C2YWX1_9BACT|nr:sigma-70 family RNA polymerase sigma factor [Tuwongella immobilis]VIP05643.1 probable extracytoplasmic function alternative sigma factor : Extracytoplasmic function alternative sigma factor OS=Rhodopirellula maiorica SM1 GN=RMSM_01476 PE=4 SV=1: Sigma70_r2 [Tuwongella immobilis]VTS08642.1 probable extracytoplasmic function alternative sigma factor : Extracytoplasmic function alternative sigma factor OS=Rhodopirellula maiorica SM1 GN=RMSM_01476 PE=4 SV=1: Sigma70_r2 [Tuwongella immobilis]
MLPQTSHTLLDELLASEQNSVAWTRFHELYTPWLRMQLAALPLQAMDRDDLIQNVLMIVFQKLPRYQHNGRTGAFRRWLRTITERETWNFCRTRARQFAELNPGQIAAYFAPDSPEMQQWEATHDAHVLRACAFQQRAMIGDHDFAVFDCLFVQGKTISETAALLHRTVAAVSMSRFRVIQYLREYTARFIDVDG